MFYDNQVFDVNGHEVDGQESGLLLALKLVFLQNGSNTTCHGWTEDEKHGLVLYWSVSKDGINKFMSPLTPEETLPNVLAWLDANEPEKFKLGKWDGNADHDGSNSKGWRVYRGDWGHVGDHWSGMCSIKPVWVWHGK